MRIGVTGANGFVGRNTVAELRDAGHTVRALVRDTRAATPDGSERIVIPALGAGSRPTDFLDALTGLDAVVHVAAHVHAMKGGDDPAFDAVNVAGGKAFMIAAADAGVNRFVFVSTVKAAGERSHGQPLRAEDPPAPEDAYGRSKLAAERAFTEIARERGVELVILRPGFVYGWPFSGNFRSVVAVLRKRIPLPFSAIGNARDMIYVGNLASAIRAAVESPNLGSVPYFLADGEAVSTPELFRRVGDALGRPALLFPLPIPLLKVLGAITGRQSEIARLTEDFTVDSAPFRRDAAWLPPYNMQQGLMAAMAAAEAAAEAGRDGPKSTGTNDT